MRNWINLFENTQTFPVSLTPDFLAEVHAYIDEHLGDWSDDFADAEILKSALTPIVSQISHSIHGDAIEVYRAELRPLDQIKHGSYGTLGSCWSWSPDGARVCHHDNAYDDHGEDVIDVMFTAEVKLDDIDWVQSLAKNLVLKGEREISVRENSIVAVGEAWCKEYPAPHLNEFSIEITSSGEF